MHIDIPELDISLAQAPPLTRTLVLSESVRGPYRVSPLVEVLTSVVAIAACVGLVLLFAYVGIPVLRDVVGLVRGIFA